MARIDNLTNFLTDVADAIRTKKGTSGEISCANFDTEIASISGGGSSSDIDEIEELISIGKSRTSAYSFSWGTMPNAQIVLCVDDTLPTVTSLCVTNAHAKNIPICFGAISSNFNLMCTKGDTTKTVLQEIKRAITNGGEVFLHGNGTINASNIDDEDFLKQKFLTEKLVFNANGLYPRGAIVIGGGNEIYNDARTDRWVRALYDFSDGWGIGEPYSHRRLAPTTLEQAKGYIDSAVANKSFIVIFAHKWYDFWNDMIDYAIGLGAEFTTWSNVVDRYGVKTFNEYTPTLSNITASKTTTSYTVGDTLSTDDISVVAHYSDESTEVVTSNATIDTSAVVMSTSGTYNITVSYGGQSTTIAITVSEVAPSPSGTIIYQASSISGTCGGTSDAKVGSTSTSWTSGKQYKYEFDYEVIAVADDSTTVSIRDVNSGDLGINLANATVGQTGHCNRTISNNNTRTRQAFLLKNVSNKSYTVKLTNVVITEL